MADDPYRYFRVEARELVDQLAKGLLDVEKGDAAAVARVLRAAHTLKGAARIVKQRAIADHAHALEDVLVPFRDGAPIAAPAIADALRAVDAIAALVAAIDRPAASPQIARTEELPIVRAGVEEIDELVDGITQAQVLMTMLRRRLDGARAGDLRGVGPLVEQIDRELHQVREDAERLRLAPARALFTALERAARDAAQAQNKRVELVTAGGEVRLDADVLAALAPALAQIVRNAVAHGIEPEAARVAAGKPPVGRIELSVARRGARIAFACADDGRGIDLDAVARVAHARGLAADARALGADGLLRLLLRGGLTTQGTATEVAGRGIGLDIVRDAIARLRGEAIVRTSAGAGTRIELEVPISLAAIDALIVLASGQTAAIPLDAIAKTMRVTTDEIIRDAGGARVLVDGEMIPFAPLARPLRLAAPNGARRAWSAVIVRGDGGRAAVGVDRLIGAENVVLRPLPVAAPADPVIAGAAFDAHGSPRPVIDPPALVAAVRAAGADSPAAAPPIVRPPVLVVDDSLTTRMLERSILEAAGYDVDLATTGEEGLAMARKRSYALMLVDVEMPGLDGFDVVTALRTDAELRRLPAIMVSSRAAQADRERAIAVGAHGYVVKGEFDQTAFLEQVRRLVG